MSENTARTAIPDDARGDQEGRLDAIDAERRTLRARREWRTKAAAVMGRCCADGHPQLLREIECSETQPEAESLLRQLKP